MSLRRTTASNVDGSCVDGIRKNASDTGLVPSRFPGRARNPQVRQALRLGL
jgi:hypothetical protein